MLNRIADRIADRIWSRIEDRITHAVTHAVASTVFQAGKSAAGKALAAKRWNGKAPELTPIYRDNTGRIR